jgi:ubiquinone/menaquinone biosynthesis C-methylase UbiE
MESKPKQQQQPQSTLKLTKPSNINDFGVSINQTESQRPTDIEKKHVYEVYDKIATHFSHTRYKPWPKVAEFLNSLPPNSLVADIGCGNGKYMDVNPNIYMYGTDRSGNLLEIVRDKIQGSQVFTAESLYLPIRSNFFDAAISIAVVHHFSNDLLRIKAIKEIARVIKQGGKFLIYVWAMEQKEKKFEHQDNFVPWHLQNKWENNVQVQSLGPDIVKDEKSDCIVYQRYYHVFKQGELEKLIEQIDGLHIETSYFDHANWCCVVTKTK